MVKLITLNTVSAVSNSAWLPMQAMTARNATKNQFIKTHLRRKTQTFASGFKKENSKLSGQKQEERKMHFQNVRSLSYLSLIFLIIGSAIKPCLNQVCSLNRSLNLG